MPTDRSPTSVGILTPHDVVAVGLRTMLVDAHVPLRLVDPAAEEPDVLLYDVYALLGGDTDELDHWVKETASIVIALTRPLRPDLGAVALDRGAEAVVAVEASAADLVSVVLSASAGTLEESEVVHAAERQTRLGGSEGLSPRETDVLRLVTLGLSNHEIADQLALSVNSIKTYIRSAYRKIGVSARHEVVAWCVRHGFPPPTE